MQILSSHALFMICKLIPPGLFLHQIEEGDWIIILMISIQSVHTNRLFKPVIQTLT